MRNAVFFPRRRIGSSRRSHAWVNRDGQQDNSPVSPALLLHSDLLLLAIRFRRDSLVSKHRSAFGRVSPRPPGYTTYSIRRHPVLTPHFQLIKQLLPPGKKGALPHYHPWQESWLAPNHQSPQPTNGGGSIILASSQLAQLMSFPSSSHRDAPPKNLFNRFR
ncbi:hypothetical protein CTAM01_13451 [Colletotrichum tamarilloi]|uniref:Uncharacterized protein n=1 Tax=Colletotrichum tamarilloi TaxID=1209934 RepID=A0ABQ9QRZ3_9PEZI|nr:uncharacterized protein CTAM01_13451 [Colletotrichum tamarilloi]KAK1483374.1 hypothetical protein CTAM01_13451 [Colletotrichum tamarilloi]